MVNTAIGAGILALPGQFQNTGLIFGLVILLIISFLTMNSLLLLESLGRSTGCSSYVDMSRLAYGNWGKCILALCIFIMVLAGLSCCVSVMGLHLDIFPLVVPNVVP